MKPLENLVSPQVAEALGTTFMHAIWQLALLALGLMLVLAFVPRNAARVRYVLGVATLSLMLIFPIATYMLEYTPAASGLGATADTAATFQAMPKTMAFTPLPVNIPTRHPSGLLEEVQGFFQSNAYIFLVLWLTGALFFSLRFMLGYLQVRRIRTQGTSPVEDALADRFSAILSKLNIRRRVTLLYSNAIDTPLVVGALKPLVLLPAGLLSGMSMEQVECILIHELAHVRRWDYLVNILQSLAEIVLFFHPATWWVSRLVRDERENCCDEIVLAHNANKVQYARALLNLEIVRQQRPELSLAANGGALSRRIRRITGGSQTEEPRFYARGLVFGFITLLGVLVLATQSHNVVKAAMPYFTEEEPEDQKPKTKTDDPKPGQVNAQLANRVLQSMPSIPVTLVGQFGQLFTVVQDSPVTKVIMNDKGAEVILEFDKQGHVVAGTRNGGPIPAQNLPEYQSMADGFFSRGASPLSPLSPMPPMPPMPPMGPMSPMPPMPPMPAMPPMGADWENGDSVDFYSDRYERAMEGFGAEMEKWGESFAKAFESQEWGKFEADMERWGQGLAHHITGEDNPEMKELHEQIARLHGQLEKADSKSKRADLETEIEELNDRLGEMHSEAFSARMEDFGQKMEAWGDHYAAQMERWAEKMEAESSRLAEEADVMAEQAEEQARRSEQGADAIGERLKEDGLISNHRNYKLKIDDKEMYIDGKRQSKETYQQYKPLIEDVFDTELDSDGIMIHRRD